MCGGGGEVARKHADRQTKGHSFLPPPLSHLLCFVLFFRRTAVFYCSVSEMRYKTARFVVCLPLTSVCLYHILPAPLSLPLPTFFPSSVLYPLLSLFLSPLCPISLWFFGLSCISSIYSLYSSVLLSMTPFLCATLAAICYLFLYLFLFCSVFSLVLFSQASA